MISHKYKFILVNPPKTGSTSLCHAFLKFADVDKVYSHDNSKTLNSFDFSDEISHRSKHSSLQDISQKINIFDYTLVGSIRNPYSRIVSHWKMVNRDRVKLKKSQIDFRKWIKTAPPLSSPEYKMTSLFSYDSKVVINNFIRLENIQEDFKSICDKIGLPSPTLTHKNKSSNDEWKSHYDNVSREIVRESFGEDLDYFGYKFDA